MRFMNDLPRRHRNWSPLPDLHQYLQPGRRDVHSLLCFRHGRPGRGKGNIIPLGGSAAEEVLRSRSTLLIDEKNVEETRNRFPGLNPMIQSGFRSMILVPLVSKEKGSASSILGPNIPTPMTPPMPE